MQLVINAFYTFKNLTVNWNPLLFLVYYFTIEDEMENSRFGALDIKGILCHPVDTVLSMSVESVDQGVEKPAFEFH